MSKEPEDIIDLPAESAGWTEAQRSELRAARAEAAAAQRELDAVQKATKRAEAELTKTRRDQAIRDAIGERFHSKDDVQKLIGKNLYWDTETGTHVIREGGPNSLPKMNASLEPMTLEEYVEQFASERPYMVRGTQTGSVNRPSYAPQNEFANVTSKADLKGDPKLISRFVDVMGLEAFERLKLK